MAWVTAPASSTLTFTLSLTLPRIVSRAFCAERRARFVERLCRARRRCWVLMQAAWIEPATETQRTARRCVEMASEREKAIWQRARACSPILAALLTAQMAELLVELGTEPTAQVVELSIVVAADSGTESARDFARVQMVAHSPV